MSDRSLKIIKILKQAYPDAGPMLKFSSKYELLLAVVMSAQSTDDQVNRVTAELFAEYNTPAAFAAMPINELEEKIKGVGLYKNKAKNIKKLSEALLEQYGGEVPGDFDALINLPGVGRKSANVILAVGFQRPGLGVDTHVQRVANRLGLVQEKYPENTEKALKKIISEELWSITHHLLIFHGRKVCKARRPDCLNCCINSLCDKVIL